MFIELREYRMRPGKRDEWIALMEDVIIPGQTAKGAVVLGSFAAEGDGDLYVWLRRFESEEHRDTFYKAYYESPEWLDGLKARVGELIDREQIVVSRIVPTASSKIQ